MFEVAEIVPDQEQARVWEKVKEHFERALEDEKKSPIYDGEALERLDEVLAAIDERDWSQAYAYFERAIAQLKEEYEMMSEKSYAEEAKTLEHIKEEIEILEDLQASLELEEKSSY